MTTTKNNIPIGYKDSAVGIIPEEWEVKRLGTIAKCFSGGTPKSESEEMYGGTIPFIRSGEIHSDKTALYLTDEGLSKSSAKMVDVGDLIFALYGANSGDCAISQINGAINQAILCIRSSSVINPFLQFYLELQKDKNIAKYLQGGQGNLSGEIVCSYTIPVPPMAEQRKIAEILGVWDEAIEKQNLLIEKLELRKRALMQRLLTGKTRLPGFTEPWQKVKLGEIGKITSAGVDKKVNEGEVSVRLLNFVDVFYRDFIYDNELTHWVTAKSIKVEQCSVKKGDIFFTPSSEIPTDIALSAVAMEDMGNVVYSYHIVRLRPHIEIDLYYRAYAFKTDEFYKQAKRICDGSGQRYVISQDGFRNMSIHLPPLPEQKAIAEVLSTADKEIAIHSKTLDALRLQKRGLMQQLLTGKTRVKI